MHATLNAFLDEKMTVTMEQTGEQFALRLKSDKEGTLLVWLSKEQLNALGFAVEVAQQEAEQAAYDAEGEDMLDAWIDASKARGVFV
jgi:hypothetical protein